jgi:hypothetical protein
MIVSSVQKRKECKEKFPFLYTLILIIIKLYNLNYTLNLLMSSCKFIAIWDKELADDVISSMEANCSSVDAAALWECMDVSLEMVVIPTTVALTSWHQLIFALSLPPFHQSVLLFSPLNQGFL